MFFKKEGQEEVKIEPPQSRFHITDVKSSIEIVIEADEFEIDESGSLLIWKAIDENWETRFLKRCWAPGQWLEFYEEWPILD